MLASRGAMPREEAARQPRYADIDGFSLHAAVRVEAHDRTRLEQLCLYITRPALSGEWVRLDAAGQVELRLKRPWRDRTTHLVMSPLEFMQRLAALVPAAEAAPHPVWLPRNFAARSERTPASRTRRAGREREAAGAGGTAGVTRGRGRGKCCRGCRARGEIAQARPNRISWARLLKRAVDIDMQHCPNCGGGELKVIRNVGVRVATASVSTGVPVFGAVLKREDLLAVAAHPEAFFVASSLRFDAGGKLTELRGEFTLRCVGQPLTLRALRSGCRREGTLACECCGGDSKGELQRSSFGIAHSLPADRALLRRSGRRGARRVVGGARRRQSRAKAEQMRAAKSREASGRRPGARSCRMITPIRFDFLTNPSFINEGAPDAPLWFAQLLQGPNAQPQATRPLIPQIAIDPDNPNRLQTQPGVVSIDIYLNLERGERGQTNAIVLHMTGGNEASTLGTYANPATTNGAHFLITRDGRIIQTAGLDQRTNHVGSPRPKGYLPTADGGNQRIDADLTPESEDILDRMQAGRLGFGAGVRRLGALELAKPYGEDRADENTRGPINADSIGIEFEVEDVNGVYPRLTDAQIASGKALVELLQRQYGLDYADVYEHPDVSYKMYTEARGVTRQLQYYGGE
jgi:hypothetical protein